MLHQKGGGLEDVYEAPWCEVPQIRSVKSNPGLGQAWPRRHTRLLKVLGGATAAAVLVGVAGPTVGAVRRSMEVRTHRRDRAAAATSSEPCSYADNDACPALQLLASPDVHEVATDTLIEAGRFFLGPEDAGFVHATVIAGFANITARLDQRSPEVLTKLAELQITEKQKDIALGSLRLIGSTRVQSIGREVAKAIRDSPSFDIDIVRRSIEERMGPHAALLGSLRSEMESLLHGWSQDDKWVMALDPEGIRVLQNFHGGEFISVSPQDMVNMPGVTDVPVTPTQLSYVLLGGVLEEGRALFHIVNFLSQEPQAELKVPMWATSMMDLTDLDPGLLSCEIDPKAQSKSIVHLTKVLFCPLKFGVLGLEALRATAPSGELAMAA